MNQRQTAVIAVHLIMEQDGKILLSRRFNTGYEDGNYSVVAGHVDNDERIKSAMVREAYEEAGIVIDEDHLEILHIMHRKSDDLRIDFFLKATDWERSPRNLEPHKCDDLSWFSASKLPENIVPYVKFALENIVRGNRYSEFGW